MDEHYRRAFAHVVVGEADAVHFAVPEIGHGGDATVGAHDR